MRHHNNRLCASTCLGQRMLFGILLLSFSLTARAVPIVGEIGFSGAFNPLDENGVIQPDLSAPGTSEPGNTTGIDFIDDEAFVLSATDDFSALLFSTATFTDFQFTGPNSDIPVDPLWSVGGFSFVLTSVSVVTQTATALELSGLGTVSGAGFDATAGTWSFSGDSNGMAFAWSGGTAAVPAPPMLWLLGSGVIGMIGVSRTKKRYYGPDAKGEPEPVESTARLRG